MYVTNCLSKTFQVVKHYYYYRYFYGVANNNASEVMRDMIRYNDISVSYPTVLTGLKNAKKWANTFLRIAGFMAVTGCNLDEAYEYFSQKFNKTSGLGRYWFGQRDNILGLITIADFCLDVAADIEQELKQYPDDQDYKSAIACAKRSIYLHPSDQNEAYKYLSRQTKVTDAFRPAVMVQFWQKLAA